MAKAQMVLEIGAGKTPVMKYHSTDSWFCRVYYKSTLAIYCWMEAKKGNFELYHCTAEGEPEYVIKFINGGKGFKFDAPQGGEHIDARLLQFLTEQGHLMQPGSYNNG